MDFHTALLVLFLAPKAYLPLRVAGAAFHDSAEGIAVAHRTFTLLDAPVPGAARPARPAPASDGLRLDQVTVRYPGREAPAVDEVSLRIHPGERLRGDDRFLVSTRPTGEILLTPVASVPKRELLVWEDAGLRASLLRGLTDAAQGRVAQRDDLFGDDGEE